MPSVFDVAKYILERRGSMSAMKLQKLVYYSQAWSLVWDEEPLFPERIEAWSNGPVCPILYEQHKGEFKVNAAMIPQGNRKRLSKEQKKTVDTVLSAYGRLNAQTLSDMTHKERPWIDARGNLPPLARGHEEIKPSAMHEYYSAL